MQPGFIDFGSLVDTRQASAPASLEHQAIKAADQPLSDLGDWLGQGNEDSLMAPDDDLLGAWLSSAPSAAMPQPAPEVAGQSENDVDKSAPPATDASIGKANSCQPGQPVTHTAGSHMDSKRSNDSGDAHKEVKHCQSCC